MTENQYIQELKKFIGHQVTITQIDGTKKKGKLKAISYNHLNAIIMTDKKKICIKNLINIERERDYQPKIN